MSTPTSMTSYSVQHTVVTEHLSPVRVYTSGTGAPLVYLHGPFGQEWTPYLDGLAIDHQVYAPEAPGAERLEDLTELRNIWDLVMFYDELFDRLGLDRFDLIGHSFGGLVAAEYAAVFRHRVNRLVLIDPMGLWRDEAPIGDFVNGDPEVLRTQLWVGEPPTYGDTLRPRTDIDPDEAIDELLRRFLSVASAANYAHPIPDTGLKARLHRISAPTQIIWGEQDGFVPVTYADDFHKKISDSRLEVIADAAHYPHIEQSSAVLATTKAFLNG